MIQHQVIKKGILKERYNEALFKKTESTMEKNDSVMKKLNIT